MKIKRTCLYTGEIHTEEATGCKWSITYSLENTGWILLKKIGTCMQ